MKKIWKYVLNVRHNVLLLPKGANVMSVQFQKDTTVMWVEMDPEAEREERTFKIVCTGDCVPPGSKKYIGTVQEFDEVIHIYETFE